MSAGKCTNENGKVGKWTKVKMNRKKSSLERKTSTVEYTNRLQCWKSKKWKFEINRRSKFNIQNLIKE